MTHILEDFFDSELGEIGPKCVCLGVMPASEHVYVCMFVILKFLNMYISL